MNSLMQQVVEEENLYAAWRKVRANHGGAGTDDVTLSEFEENLPRHLSDLAEALRQETYLPLPLKHASLPKKSGGVRELQIPAVVDRVAQRAVVERLEPLFERIFLPCSFGYRPKRGVHDAIERVLAYRAAGLEWIVDADIQDFFPSVDHAVLHRQLQRTIADRAVLRVIQLWLEAGAMAREGTEESVSLLDATAERVRGALLAAAQFVRDSGGTQNDWEDSSTLRRFSNEAARLAWDYRQVLLPLVAGKGALIVAGVGAAAVAGLLTAHRRRQKTPEGQGTPQGGPISPLLSNVHLHDFDRELTESGLRLVRYADDFLICCPSESRARQAREKAARALERLGLTLHPEKTRILSFREPLEFLGHAFDGDGALPATNAAPSPRKTPRQGPRVLDELREPFDERRKGKERF